MVELLRVAARLEEELRQLSPSPFEFEPGVRLTTCSAEDLVVLKAFAGRSKDWGDIESLCLRQGSLDWEYIDRQLGPLVEAKEAPEILEHLRRVRVQTAAP